MTVVFMDGFDHYATEDFLKKWDDKERSLAGFGFLITDNYRGVVPRRSATYAKFLYMYEWAIVKTFDYVLGETTSYNPTIVIGMAQRQEQLGGNALRLTLRNPDGNSHLRIEYGNSDGSFKAYNGYGNLIVESAPNTYTTDEWYHVDFKFHIHDTAGSFEIRRNEVVVASVSGIDTKRYGGGISDMKIHAGWYGLNSKIAYLDDLYVLDCDFSPNDDLLGDCRIDPIYPNAAGAYTDFDPVPAVANYLNVDDIGDIDDDLSFNESNTVGHRDCYNLESVTPLGTPIYAAAQNSCMRKTDAGNRYVTQFVRIGGVNYPKDEEIRLTDNYKVYQRPMDLSPDSDLPWTEPELDGTESGIEVTS